WGFGEDIERCPENFIRVTAFVRGAKRNWLEKGINRRAPLHQLGTLRSTPEAIPEVAAQLPDGRPTGSDRKTLRPRGGWKRGLSVKIVGRGADSGKALDFRLYEAPGRVSGGRLKLL